MAQMTGTCTYCGQTRLVDADSQRQADLVATENCACDNIMKKRRMILDQHKDHGQRREGREKKSIVCRIGGVEQ